MLYSFDIDVTSIYAPYKIMVEVVLGLQILVLSVFLLKVGHHGVGNAPLQISNSVEAP